MASRHARRRDEDIAPYRNGTGPRDLATGPRNGARAVRMVTGHGGASREAQRPSGEPPRATIAPYRNGIVWWEDGAIIQKGLV